MTSRHAGGHAPTTAAVQIRGRSRRANLSPTPGPAHTALFDRPEMVGIGGEVRITRAAAHHAEQPWSATAEIQVEATSVVHARETSAHALADRWQDPACAAAWSASHTARTRPAGRPPRRRRGGPSDDQEQDRAERTP